MIKIKKNEINKKILNLFCLNMFFFKITKMGVNFFSNFLLKYFKNRLNLKKVSYLFLKICY